MTWTVKIEPEYLRIVCTGSFDLVDAKRVGAEAYTLAAQHERHAVLMDWREVEGTPSDTDRYEMGKSVADAYAAQQPIRYVRVAVVGREPLLSKSRIGQTVARNRGAQGIVTDSLEEALDYLQVPKESNGDSTSPA